MIRRWIPLWAIAVIAVMAIGTVWLRLAIVRTTYDITQTNRQLANLGVERQQLELKTAGLRSPKRLEHLAKTKFGLSQPRPEQVVHLR